MKHWKSVLFVAALSFATSLFSIARAQQPYPPYPPPPPPHAQRPMFFLGMAHVDGPTDHDDIKVGRYAGRYHAIVLQVRYAPIQFDHVVIHYGDGYAQPLPVNALIEMVFEMPEEISGQKNRNVLCQGRVIRSRDNEGKEAREKDDAGGVAVCEAHQVP